MEAETLKSLLPVRGSKKSANEQKRSAMSTESSNQPSDLWNKATQALARNKKKKKKSRSLPLGRTPPPPVFAKNLRSSSFNYVDHPRVARVATLNDLEKLSDNEAFRSRSEDNSISTETTASTTTVGGLFSAAMNSPKVAGKASITNFIQEGSFSIRSKKVPPQRKTEEETAILKRRGLCENCGVRTHKLTRSRRVPMSNTKVSNGICLRCNASCNRNESLEWETHHPRGSLSSNQEDISSSLRGKKPSSSKQRRAKSTHYSRLDEPTGRGLQRHSSEGNVGSQNNPRLTKMMKHLAAGDYDLFSEQFESMETTEAEALNIGIRAFRETVSSAQNANPKTKILTNEIWLRAIISKMDGSDENLLVQCLLTFLTFSSLFGDYHKTLVTKGAVKAACSVLDSINQFSLARELACAFLFSMKAYEPKYQPNEETIRKLIEVVVNGDETSSQEYALQTLLYIAKGFRIDQSKNRDRMRALRESITEPNTIASIVSLLSSEYVHDRTVEAAFYLWLLHSPSGGTESRENVVPTKELIQCMLSFLGQENRSREIVESGYILVANLAMHEEFPEHAAPQIVETIYDRLSSKSIPNSAQTIINGMHAISNLMANPTRRRLSEFEGRLAGLVSSCLSGYPNEPEVLSLASELVEFVCSSQTFAVNIFISQGGFELLCRGLFRHLQAETNSFEVTSKALNAIEKVTRSKRGAKVFLEANFLSIVESETTTAKLKSHQPKISSIVRNAVLIPLLPDEDVIFLDSSRSALQHTDADMMTLELSGPLAVESIECMLKQMNRLSGSFLVQQESCRILAESLFLYATKSCPGIPLPVIEQMLNSVRLLMRRYRGVATIQSCACCIISNLLPVVSSSELSNAELIPLINPFLGDVLDVFEFSKGDSGERLDAINAFWYLSDRCDSDFVEIFAPKIVTAIFNSSLSHGGSSELSNVLLDFVWALKDKPEIKSLVYSEVGVSLILRLSGDEDEGVAVKSSGLLVNLLNDEDLPSLSLLLIFRSSQCLMRSMGMHRHNWRLQSNLSSILASLMDKPEGLDFPGLHNHCHKVLCDVLAIHSCHRDVVMRTCQALERSLPIMQLDHMEKLNPSLFGTLQEIIEANLEDEHLCASCAAVLSAGCCHDTFRSLLEGTLGCVKAVIRAVKYHLGAISLQFYGCIIMSSLSDFGATLRGKIVDYGGTKAVINCMLAHVDKSELQRVAFPALRKLASAAPNTRLLQEISADAAIFLVLTYHFQDPRIVSESFLTLAAVLTDSMNYTASWIDEISFLHVLEGMKRFPIDGAVQEHGCKLLHVCSFNNSNLKTIKSHLGDLLHTVFRAAQSFPQHCKETVSAIITMVSSEFPLILEEEVEKICRRSLSLRLPLIESNVVFAVEGQRDESVSVLLVDGRVREEPIYLRRKDQTKEPLMIAYQRLSFCLRNDHRFRPQILESCSGGFVLICSLLYKPRGDKDYRHVKEGERKRNLVLINKYSIDQMDMSKVSSALRLYRVKLHSIVRCKDIIQDHSSMYIVYEVPGLEDYGNRTLKERVLPATLHSINRFGTYTFDEMEVKRTFSQMLSEVRRLHAVGFYHGNISPSAFLDLGRNGITMCDIIGPLFFSSRPHTSSARAVDLYVAPECELEDEVDRFIADVWSLGATLFALLTRSELSHAIDDRSYQLFIAADGLRDDTVIDAMMGEILTEDSFERRNRLWLSILGVRRLSTSARELLSLMLQPDPDSRITIEGILKHEWMHGLTLPCERNDRPTPGSAGGSGSFPVAFDEQYSGTPKSHVGEPSGETQSGNVGADHCGKQSYRRRVVYGRKSRAERGKKIFRDSESDSESDDDNDGSGNLPFRNSAGSHTTSRFSDCITMIQSSPLAYNSHGQMIAMGQLNIHEERRVLTDAIKDANADVKILFEIATADRLGAVLSNRQARILHFSGHGRPGYLALEDELGAMQPLLVHELIDLVSPGGTQNNAGGVHQTVEFVFVSACCSRSIGEALVEAGVPHVVCCDQDTQQIRDDITVAFQKALYRALTCGNTLRTAFLRARKEIQYSSLLAKEELETEMRKFCLIPENGDHDVQLFSAEKSSDASSKNSVDTRQARIPPPPSPFIGRQVETYNMNCALNKSRLVRVSGEKGIGKKALAKFHCRFVDDRRHIHKFDEVIWYPNPIENSSISLNQLFESLYDCAQSEKENERVMNLIIRNLYNRRVLLVLEANGTRRINKFLLRLFHHNESVKVILIHSDDDDYAQRSMPCIEQGVRVPRLDIESNVILFCNMCSFLDNPRAVKEKLLQAYVEKPLWRKDIERMIGDGIPSQVLRSSKEITEADLKRILEVGERKSVDITFKSRAELLQKKEELERAKSSAIRKGDFATAGGLQFQLDEVEKLKEEFPDIETMKRRKADMQYRLRKLIDQDMYGTAARLRIDLDKLEERIVAERAAMERHRPSCQDDYVEYSLEKLKSNLRDLNSRLRLALDENDFSSAKEINEKIKTIEERKYDMKQKEESMMALLANQDTPQPDITTPTVDTTTSTMSARKVATNATSKKNKKPQKVRTRTIVGQET